MDALKDFAWFFVIILALAIVWFLSGGPDRESAKNPFINPPNPISSGKTYGTSFFSGRESNASTSNIKEQKGTIEEQLKTIGEETARVKDELKKVQEKASLSEYSDLITFSRGNATAISPDKEYLQIILSKTAKNKIIITGWELKSLISGVSVKIGEASWLPRLGSSNIKNTIVLSPGEKAIIITGRPPIGVSFRTNICSGYFGQFQNFYPSLKAECPDPYGEIEEQYLSGPNAYNDSCLDFIDRIRRCGINTEQLPLGMQSQCQDFVTKKINYNSCIDKHKNDENFYRGEWRVYLSRDTELWKSKREVIKLIDEKGKDIGTITY
ncbi:MAG: prefoldin domain-containing protein [Patescibacteria group bacterium]